MIAMRESTYLCIISYDVCVNWAFALFVAVCTVYIYFLQSATQPFPLFHQTSRNTITWLLYLLPTCHTTTNDSFQERPLDSLDSPRTTVALVIVITPIVLYQQETLAGYDLIKARARSIEARGYEVDHAASNPPEPGSVTISLDNQDGLLNYRVRPLRSVSDRFQGRKWIPTHNILVVKENKCFEIGGWAFSLIKLEQAADLTGAIPGIEMHKLAWLALTTRLWRLVVKVIAEVVLQREMHCSPEVYLRIMKDVRNHL